MQLRDNGLRFSPITIWLHWVVVVLLLAIFALAVVIAQTTDAVAKMQLVQVQNLLGTVLFVVSLYRLWDRLTSWHPLPVGTPNPVEVIVSRSVAVALGLAMVLLPIAVWLSRAAAGVAVELPGGYALPRLFAPHAQLKYAVDMLLGIGTTAFLLGLALHIFGALKNHFVLKNPALLRMLGKHVEL